MTSVGVQSNELEPLKNPSKTHSGTPNPGRASLFSWYLLVMSKYPSSKCGRSWSLSLVGDDEKVAASQESASFEKTPKLDLSQSGSVEAPEPQKPRPKPGGYKVGEFKVSGSGFEALQTN